MIKVLLDKRIITVIVSVVFFQLIGCKSLYVKTDSNNYKNINCFLQDYLSLSYSKGYIEDYDVFNVMIDSVRKDYFLISIYPSHHKVILNSDSQQEDLFPQSYKDIKGETFFIDFQYKKPSKEVYAKLVEKDKIDSTYILIEQGELSQEKGYILQKFDDSIYSQNYLVKKNKNKLELIYEWFGR